MHANLTQKPIDLSDLLGYKIEAAYFFVLILNKFLTKRSSTMPIATVPTGVTTKVVDN